MIFTDLDTAVREHPELVQRYFGSVVATDENKFSALHYALWNSGTFVYVPRNVDHRAAAPGRHRPERRASWRACTTRWW